MKIFLYLPDRQELGHGLHACIMNRVANGQLAFFESFKKMSACLRQFLQRGDIVIFQASTTGELDKLVFLRDLFEDVRLILILPQRSAETIAKAHLLRPRFITFADNDISEIPAVLEKMLLTPSSFHHH